MLWTAAAFVVALAVRWVVFWHWYRHLPIGDFNDNVFYHESANLLADGRGFINPFSVARGISEPTAAHPPGFSVYLSIWSLLGLDSVSWHRVASGLISATVVVPVGLVVRRLAGHGAAVMAMLVAALYPPLFMNDGLILSESMYIPLAALSIWMAYRYHDEPGVARVVGLAAVLAVGALTRGEAFLLFFFLLTPLVMLDGRLAWRRRLALTTMAAMVAMVIISPWALRNLTSFEQPTFIAVGAGYVLEIGNCDETYSGDFLGYWHPACDDGSAWPDGDESTIGEAKLDRAREYISDHIDEQPKVISARVGRLFGLYRPIQTADLDVLFERRVEVLTRIGLFAHYLVMAAAVAGLTLLRRRGESVIPLLAMIFTAVITAAMSFGITRYRIGADVALVVLASVAVAGAIEHRRLGPADPESESDPVIEEPSR